MNSQPSVTQTTDDEIERWYAAFEKVSGSIAVTAEGHRRIYDEFMTAWAKTTLHTEDPTCGACGKKLILDDDGDLWHADEYEAILGHE